MRIAEDSILVVSFPFNIAGRSYLRFNAEYCLSGHESGLAVYPMMTEKVGLAI
jgi:hypothetical protein